MRYFLNLLSYLVLATSVSAQEPKALSDVLSEFDRTPVLIEGRIAYRKSENEFRFISDKGDWFGVSLDAGRDAREQVEANCATGLMYRQNELCRCTALGTVEVRGGQFFLSISEFIMLEKE